MTPSSTHMDIARLVLGERWAAVATLEDGGPVATMVAYAAEPGLEGLLLFVSLLSAHTRNMLENPRVSVAVSAPDTGDGDPQLLPRVSLKGLVSEIDRPSSDFDAAAARYVARFPSAEMRFQLGDFKLLRFVVDEGRYVGGFARAFTVSGAELREAAEAVEAASGS
jgi:putative heme iron utilization protein